MEIGLGWIYKGIWADHTQWCCWRWTTVDMNYITHHSRHSRCKIALNDVSLKASLIALCWHHFKFNCDTAWPGWESKISVSVRDFAFVTLSKIPPRGHAFGDWADEMLPSFLLPRAMCRFRLVLLPPLCLLCRPCPSALEFHTVKLAYKSHR